MTQNQIAYWALIWKQHYENQQLKETHRHNQAQEKETNRHNLAEERIAKQQLVLRRIELSQNQEKINQEWAKLSNTIRHDLIEEAQSQQKINLDIDKFMSNQKIAVAQMALDASYKANDTTIKYIEASAKALKEGWGKGAAALGLGTLYGSLNTSNYSQIVESLASDLGITNSSIISAVKSNYGSSSETKSILEKINAVETEKEKSLIELYGPDAQNRKGNITGTSESGVPVANPSNATAVPKSQGHSSYDSEGNTVHAQNSTQSDSPGTIRVVSKHDFESNRDSHSSGGTNYHASGGLHSSGTIISGGSSGGPGTIL